MAAFPTVKFSWRELGEDPDSLVARAPMERGMPKQRRLNSDARIQIALTIYFDTKTQAADFETWFFDTIHGGQDWFDFTHPRTGATVTARVVGGKLGALSFENSAREASHRSLQVEWWRPAA